MKIAPLIGLVGVLVAVMSAQLNDALTTTALQDVGGEIGIGSDTAVWLPTLYVTGEVLGMAVAPTLATVFTIRRFALFAIGFALGPTMLLALCREPEAFLTLRLVQGFAGGLTIPLLMMTALKVLEPPVRLYGLAVYCLSATFAPYLANTLAAFWIDRVEDYRFLYLQAAPFAAIAAVLVWWGLDQDEPKYNLLRRFDWPGAVIVAVGFGSFAVLLEQGDRLDWFNSPVICLTAIAAAIGVPGLVIRDLTAPQPLFMLSLLKRRNFAFGVIALVIFLIMTLSGSQVPNTFLEQVQGYRPIQVQGLSLEIALSQLLFLPLTAVLLNFRHVDARWVAFAGIVSVATACAAASRVDSSWSREQFYPWQILHSAGAAFVIMSLLMMGTNAITKPEEGPFASTLVNTPRAISEAIGIWALELITRWRGGLHRNQVADVLGERRTLPGMPSTDTLSNMVTTQVSTLVASDSFLAMLGLAAVLVVVLATLPVRTYPPRIALAKS